MKGRTSTATIIRAVLNRRSGLRGPGVLSHVSIIEIGSYPKFLLMSDPGINIAPDLQTKAAIIENAVGVAHRLGIERPKVAVIAAVEKVNPVAMPATLDAALLSKMSDRGQIQGEAANVFYKTLAHLTDAKIAALTIGARVPVVMSSRADRDDIKYLSILGAVSIA
jgi:phosphate butyryltransferase